MGDFDSQLRQQNPRPVVPNSGVYADLHTHTDYSDGVLSPASLVERAASRGVQVLSVTDHDTVEGIRSAQKAARVHGIRLVPGVELSAVVDGTEVHLLAYGVDPEHEGLQSHLESMATARKRRAERIISILEGQGLDVRDERLKEDVSADRSVGRPHVAEALVRGGHVESVRDAFDQYLGRDASAYVSKPEVPADDALTLIHDAGGVSVLAHPGHWTSTRTIRRLVNWGLDGLEIVHPSHDESLTSYYRRVARGYELLETGGSDYHGRTEDGADPLGSVGLSREGWERFWEAGS